MSEINLPPPAHPHRELLELAQLLEAHNGLWLHDGQLKYLTVHIDTRGPRFTLRDRDGNPVDMDRIKKAASGKYARSDLAGRGAERRRAASICVAEARACNRVVVDEMTEAAARLEEGTGHAALSADTQACLHRERRDALMQAARKIMGKT